LSSTKAFSIERGTTNRDTNVTLGLAVGTYGAGRTGQSLESIDISSQEGAVAAIEAIDNAINAVDESRVNMGSYQNRFTSTVSALQSTSANLTAARSRIQDADFAAESAEMSKAGILQQAGTAMLAQANASSQGVLSLLR
jgi:flagellin